MLQRIRQLKKENSGAKATGFTIIEVMIVLAIAGIIMAIVFLAIPSLQKSSRNTRRKQDASRVSAIISEFTSNNNGKLPTAFGTGSGQVNIANETWSIVTAPSGNITAWPAAAPFPAAPAVDVVRVYSGATCGPNGGDTPVAGASTRQFIVWWGQEGAPATQCLAS